MTHWTWACASQVGTSHLRTGQRLQDAHSCFSIRSQGREWFVGVVSDGAGSARFGGEGAALVCRTIGLASRRHFNQFASLPAAAEIEYWVDEVRDRIYRAASARSLEPKDFAATLICTISDGVHSVFAHIGDGCVVTRTRGSGEWTAPSWPDHGEYASTTTFVTDQPAAKVRVSVCDDPVDVIALFSDGIERMVLDMAARKPAERFFSVIAAPVLTSAVLSGKDARLSEQLRSYLDSEQVCSRTDDDKTLVIAAIR
jgi:Protein phosphatase 2C